MKVLMLNGSPRAKGNTALALERNEKGLRTGRRGSRDRAGRS